MIFLLQFRISQDTVIIFRCGEQIHNALSDFVQILCIPRITEISSVKYKRFRVTV